jgi:hypothetical protein
MNIQRVYKSLAIPALLGLLTACSGSSNTVSMSAPETDFSLYKTYNFIQAKSVGGESYETLESNYLKAAAARELEARGFTKSDDPDVAINFSFDEEEKIRTRQVPSSNYGMGYDPYLDVYVDGWATSHETRIDQYTEGKLDIDLIDVRQRKLVWQGTTRGRLTKKDYENAQKTLDEAVMEIFKKFPVQPTP